MMRVITGTFGEVLRDMVCNEIPSLFRDHRPYAICAVAGGLVYALLRWLDAPPALALGMCAVTTAGIRLLSLWRNITLPAVRSQ